MTTVTETVLSEDVLLDDCECESKHGAGSFGCSAQVTHRLSTCRDNGNWRLICQNTVAYIHRHKDGPCPNCADPLGTCHRVIPV